MFISLLCFLWSKIIQVFKSPYEPDELHSYLSSKVIIPLADSHMKAKYCKYFKPMVDDLTLVPMLRIICRKINLKIRFDENLLLNHEECNQYISNQIIVGIKGMISENTESELSGRIAQKFYNYTMLLVFKNKGRPYFNKEGDQYKTEFEEISEDCRKIFGPGRHVDLERYLNYLFKLNLVCV